jgi:hypothetical protein
MLGHVETARNWIELAYQELKGLRKPPVSQKPAVLPKAVNERPGPWE